jgi:hypothetical protein
VADNLEEASENIAAISGEEKNLPVIRRTLFGVMTVQPNITALNLVVGSFAKFIVMFELCLKDIIS